jgi:hypothetical protein
MLSEPRFMLSLAKSGAIAGVAVVLVYLLPKFVPFPGGISTLFYVYQGPIMVVGFLGIYAFIRAHRLTVPLFTAVVFAVTAAVSRMMFLVVQINNRHFIRGYRDAAEGAELKAEWANILKGVFTVQNGLNIVSDVFLDLGIILFSVACWSHPKLGKPVSLAGCAVAGLHFVLKAWTFPEPPASAGLFDVGPYVALWPLLVCNLILRNLNWMTRELGVSVP